MHAINWSTYFAKILGLLSLPIYLLVMNISYFYFQGPSFSNGNGNGANEEEPKEEPKTDSFDLFGSMISKMPAKPADEEKEKVKDEDDSNEEKKVTR